MSVVDNVLVVHHPPTAVAVLFDVALHQHTHIANPLPLRRLQLLPPDLAAAAAVELEQQQQQQGAAAGSSAAWSSGSSSSSTTAAAAGVDGEEEELRAAVSSSSISSIARTRAGFRRTLIWVPGSNGRSAAAAVAGGSPAAAAAADVWESSEVLEEGGWVFYPPAVVLDMTDKTVGRLQLDLQVLGGGVRRGGVVGGLLSVEDGMGGWRVEAAGLNAFAHIGDCPMHSPGIARRTCVTGYTPTHSLVLWHVFCLQAVVDSAEDWPSLVGFLLRRQALAPSAPH